MHSVQPQSTNHSDIEEKGKEQVNSSDKAGACVARVLQIGQQAESDGAQKGQYGSRYGCSSAVVTGPSPENEQCELYHSEGTQCDLNRLACFREQLKLEDHHTSFAGIIRVFSTFLGRP